MTSPLPPDPYRALGLSNDAETAAIKSAYRKLVLQCHPDKVQDARLKAIKQDEFQKVQEAYELLSDDARRAQYDEQVIMALRREMGRNGPPPGKTVFDYEIRTAEPRSPFNSRPTKVYAQSSPRSYEDDLGPRTVGDDLKARARKTASYEERRRPPTREDEKRRKAEDERNQERWEKEARRAEHSATKKSRDKERRRRSEEKHSRTSGPYMEDDDSDESYPPWAEKRSGRRTDEDPRIREEFVRDAENPRRSDPVLTDRTQKLHNNIDFLAHYTQAARRKVVEPEDDSRKPMRAETMRAETFQVRHAVPSPDDDLPRRSSGRGFPRRSEDIPISIRTRDPPSSGKERKGPPYERDHPFIVDATPAPSMPSFKKPTLQSYMSAPHVPPSVRKEPHRSKTSMPEYSTREVPAPPLVRSSTYQTGDKVKPVSKGSRFNEPVQYIVEGSRRVLTGDHRSELREDSFGYSRDRSESPRGSRRSAERPPPMRQGVSGSGSTHPRGTFFPSPEPIIKEARPKISTHEASGRYFGEVKYSPNYGPEHVKYSEAFRRGSDPSHHHRDYMYSSPRTGKTAAY